MEDFLEEMIELLETEQTVDMDTHLKDIEEWDSLSIVSFAAMVDIKYNKKVLVADVKSAQTVRDLFELVS